MQVELIEVRDHLSRFPPFDGLPNDVLDQIAQQVEIGYFKADSDILLYGDPIKDLHYIRSGAVEIYRRNGELYNRLAEGEVFGQFGLLRGKKVRLPARAIEDSLIYFIPGQLFAHEDIKWLVIIDALDDIVPEAKCIRLWIIAFVGIRFRVAHEIKPVASPFFTVVLAGKQAVYQAFATIIDPGDEVILPSPFWTTYPEAIKLAGGKSVEVFADESQLLKQANDALYKKAVTKN